MEFGQALQLIKLGARLARVEWMGGGPRDDAPSVGLQADGHGDGPWMYLLPAGGGRSPWAPSQPDMFANDWAVVEAARGSGDPLFPYLARREAPGSDVERAAVEVVRAYAERDEHGAALAEHLLDPMVALDDALTAGGVST